MKLVKQILFRARLAESSPAITFSGGTASFGTLARMVEAAANAIDTLSLPAGRPVMIDIRNPVQHTAIILALALLGLPSASIGSTFSVEAGGVLPGLLLVDRPDVTLEGIATQRVDDRWFMHDPARPVDYRRLLDMESFSSPDDIVRYAYSSGTTGRPKCVAFTAAVLELRVANAMLTVIQGGSGAGLHMMGFSTIAGMMALLAALPIGIMICFASSNLEALQMTRLFHVTMMVLAVVQLKGFLAALGDDPPPRSLQMVVVAGARVPLGLLRETRARLCSNVISQYGSTEMGIMTASSPAALERLEGSVGYRLPWVELQAVDAEGRAVAAGSDGILRARSPEMAFYAADGGDPVEIIRDGWFYPGDVGRIYEDGLVVVTGRTSEVINRGGVIVAPEIIEEVLRLDSLVRDVAVVGVPVNGIEEIWAAVVSDDAFDAQAIAQRAHSRLNEKVPDRILRVDAIPRNENGKVTRNVLRDTLLARVRAV